eukprot:m.24883 g.24883  ORF g.24883 m.24883 type:complete len:234 (-) comp14786_c0_seq1:129-830(-)
MTAAIYEHGICGLIGGASLLYALRIESLVDLSLESAFNFAQSPVWWAMTAALATPYCAYAWIWYHPKKWMEFSKSIGYDPISVFSTMCLTLKMVQLAAMLGWWAQTQEQGVAALPGVLMSQSSYAWGAFAVSLVAGQALNIPVYSQLGNNGVYYGFKLGKVVPWCTGFPFNTGLRHPQYLSGVMFPWGLAHLLITPSSVAAGLFQLPVAVTIMYMCISRVEEVGDADTDHKDE